jgi:chorismate synthase
MTSQTGLEVNDEFYSDGPDKQVKTKSNHSGGIQGGISNGMPILLNAAFKPTATVLRPQATVDINYDNTTLTGKGRHDPCVLPRAVPMVEAMVALVLVDHALRQRAIMLD